MQKISQGNFGFENMKHLSKARPSLVEDQEAPARMPSNQTLDHINESLYW